MEFHKEFDATGMSCPGPVMATKKVLQDMASGQILRVLATDPSSVHDMPVLAEQSGNVLVKQESERDRFVFYLRKA